MGSIVQLVPFHRSASVPAFDWPTAVQAAGDRHDTPYKMPPPCGGSAVGWILHVAPSQRSERVPELEFPTAVHDASDVQDTLQRVFCVDPAGFGVGSIDHLIPFHRSAKLTCAPEGLVE